MEKTRCLIKVDAGAVLDPVDPRIYGQNIEHMGRQVLGGLIAETGSKAPQDGDNFRLDVLESVKSLNPSLLRWPGGCFADSYRWKDGVGAKRPTVKNRMWGRFLAQHFFGNPPFPVGPVEDNRFGTDEFMNLCRKTGAEPSITASLGEDDPDEASAWIGYIKERYGAGAVPAWSVGNEQWNPVEPGGCFLRPRKYVERFHRFAGKMREADKDIKLIACGGDVLIFPGWNREIIGGIGESMDYLSMHLYTPAGIPFLSRINDSPEHYYAVAASGLAVQEQILCIEDLAEKRIGKSIPVSFDEWNILGPLRSFINPWRSMREAIGAAGIIHVFHRHANYVKIAAMFALLNAASPPIITTRDGVILTPVFHILKLYREFTGKFSVRSETACPSIDIPKLINLPERRSFPLLDASASIDGNRLTVFVINRDHAASHEAELEISGAGFSGTAEIHTVAASGYLSQNFENRPETVCEKTEEVELKEILSFHPCSVTAIVMKKTETK